MKKDLIVPPMEPFTSEEETALKEKLQALTGTALASYIESAQSALSNNALAATWRPRVELGLKVAQAALANDIAAAARLAASA
jgi:hypothetical protein